MHRSNMPNTYGAPADQSQRHDLPPATSSGSIRPATGQNFTPRDNFNQRPHNPLNTRPNIFPCKNPISPHMRDRESRKATFLINASPWPSHRLQARPGDFANAGFFYLGERDKAKCWYCNGGIQNWEYSDNPWVEHAKYFPLCEYVLQQQGVEFVQRIVSESPLIRRPEQRINNHASQVETNLIRAIIGLREVNTNHSGNSSNSAARIIIIDPRENENKRDVWANWLFENHKDIESAKDPIELAIGLNFAQDLIIEALKVMFDGMSETDRIKDDIRLCSGDLIDALQELEGAESPSSKPPVLTRTISQEYQQQLIKTYCILCKEKCSDTVFLPCGHLTTCNTCASGITKCPVQTCDRKIDSLIKTFLA